MILANKVSTLQEKAAIVFGETNLCIICMECLLNCHWEIPVVVSQDKTVVSWCQNNKIKCIKITEIDKITEIGFYVFSIINPYIIPIQFLKNKQVKLAINYHDSLLPLYAGVNSTTWSIINAETIHGVTWHVITDGIDEGDIVQQCQIPIDASATAFSLNLACTELGYELFKALVIEIDQDQLCFIRQNVKNKSYFGRKHLPPNYAFIDQTTSTAAVDRLFRALDFGKGYVNTVASVKVRFNQQSYILTRNTQLNEGTVIELSGNHYQVLDMYGKTNVKLDDKAICNEVYLSPDELRILTDIKAQEFKHEINLIDKADSYAIELQESFTTPSRDYSEVIIELELPINYLVLLSCINVWWSRVEADSSFISVYHSTTHYPVLIRELIDQISLIPSGLVIHDLTFVDLLAITKHEFKHSMALMKDFFYRYNFELKSSVGLIMGLLKSKIIINFWRHKSLHSKNSANFYEYIRLKSFILCHFWSKSRIFAAFGHNYLCKG